MSGLSSFWNEPKSDPKRKFRWFLTMTPDAENAEALYIAAKTIDKPKYEITSTQHQFINHQFNFPGRLKWQTISATFVDLASSDGSGIDVATTFYEILKNSGYIFPTDPEDCKRAITKESAVTAFGSNFAISQLNGEGVVIEEWKLTNAWISTFEFGSLDYGTEDLVEITATIVYDHAEKTK